MVSSVLPSHLTNILVEEKKTDGEERNYLNQYSAGAKAKKEHH